MKKTLLLGLIVFLSIGHIKADDTAYSDEIQDTFFGVKFGASREDAKATFLDKGLKIESEAFNYIFIKDIYFGGYYWNGMLLEFRNNRFASILFVKNSDGIKTIEEEYSIFQNILSDLNKKYNMRFQNKDGEDYHCVSLKQKIVCLNFDFKQRDIHLAYFDEMFYTDNSDQF